MAVMAWHTASSIPGGRAGLKACVYLVIKTAKLIFYACMKIFK